MKPPLAAAVVAIAVAGCGGSARPASEASRPAPHAALVDLVPLTALQAARRAQRIAVVRARGSQVVEGAPGTPFTRTAFAVERVLKGRLPPAFVLRVIGGRLGDDIVPSPVPAFAPGGRYVLFLGPDGPAGPTVFPQGIFRIGPGGVRLRDVLTPIRRAMR